MKKIIVFIAIMTVVISGLFADDAYARKDTDSFSGDEFIYFFIDDAESSGLFILKINMTKNITDFIIYDASNVIGVEGFRTKVLYRFDDEDTVETSFILTDFETVKVDKRSDWIHFNDNIMKSSNLIVRVFERSSNTSYYDYSFDLETMYEIFRELGIM
jgi:hypothetical protein